MTPEQKKESILKARQAHRYTFDAFRLLGCPISKALTYAQDAEKHVNVRRYGSHAIFYNKPTEKGLRWIENLSAGLRVVPVEKLIRTSIRGWYVNNFQHETTEAFVIRLPHGRLVAACSDPWNEDSFLVDFQNITTDETAAAHWAERLAESYADEEREGDLLYQTEQATETLNDEISTTRKKIIELCRQARLAKQATPNSCAAYPAIVQAIRDQVADLLDDINKARKSIDRWTNEPWTMI